MCCRNELNAKGPKEKVKGQEKTLETERALRFDLLGLSKQRTDKYRDENTPAGPQGTNYAG